MQVSELISVARGPAPNVVAEAARAAGFDLCGIAGVEPSAQLAAFPDWIARGQAGAMDYLARRGPDGRYLREAIQSAYPWARSVICLALNYNSGHRRPAPQSPWISRYAWGDDYHAVLLSRLDQLIATLRDASPPGTLFRPTVDTAPIVEREAARAAGLGWQGKNTCLIHPQLGSWFFLGAILTSLDLAPAETLPDRCGSCTRCLDACPTQALTPYAMDATRCLAYLNIELRGPIPEAFRAPMGENLIGCDICQDVCPWNRKAPPTSASEFQPRPGLLAPDLHELASLDEDAWRVRFRHSAARRTKFSGFQRNLAIAMGNSGNPAFLPRLQSWAAADGDLAEHATWAIQQIHHASAHSGTAADPSAYALPPQLDRLC